MGAGAGIRLAPLPLGDEVESGMRDILDRLGRVIFDTVH